MIKTKIKHNIVIYPLLAVVFALHFLINILAGNVMISDETFYVTAANSLLQGTGANFEHPPLVKLIMAGAISIMGNNWIAWRLPIIIFAVIAVFLTYKIGKTFLTENQAIYATALMSTSLIFFLIGSIGMLDIPMIAFSLAGIYFLIKQKYISASAMFAVAFLCKETAIMFAGAALIYMLIKHVSWRKIFPTALVFVTIILVGLGIYDFFFNQTVYGITITNPIQQAAAILLYQFRLNSQRILNPYPAYPPIGWVTPFGLNALNPQLWAIGYSGKQAIVQWLMQPNPFIEYTMFPLLFALAYLYRKAKQNIPLLLWLTLAFTYLPWLVAGIFFKTESPFYIYASVPFLALGTTYLLTKIKNIRTRRTAMLLYFAASLSFFIYYFPLNFWR
jgi:predicted membrane-bound dolichyl-phosphate-mannose-protein mannosyltransferase